MDNFRLVGIDINSNELTLVVKYDEDIEDFIVMFVKEKLGDDITIDEFEDFIEKKEKGGGKG